MNRNAQVVEDAKALYQQFCDEMGELLGEAFPVGTRVSFRVYRKSPRPTNFVVTDCSGYASHLPVMQVQSVKSGDTRWISVLSTKFEDPAQ